MTVSMKNCSERIYLKIIIFTFVLGKEQVFRFVIIQISGFRGIQEERHPSLVMFVTPKVCLRFCAFICVPSAVP